MTRTTNARIAGCTFLLYIVVGIGQMFVGKGTTSGEGTAAKLASIAQHAPQVRLNLLLTLLICFIALALAVALYGITRDEDDEIALLALACRVVEGGVTPVISIVATLGLLWLATGTDARAPDAAAAYPLAAFLLKVKGWTPLVGATFFAVGSALFSWLLLRGRMIPTSLGWLGLVASILLVIGLPLQLTGALQGSVTQLMWIPMAAFEVPLGFWLLIKGVPELRPR
jgi:uncharacterized MAPEG superfamily protein